MRSTRTAALMALLIAGHVLAGDAPTGDGTSPAPSPTLEHLNELLDQLGHDRFEDREQATEALIKLGAASLEAVMAREKDTQDVEIRERCIRIREAIGDPNATALAVLDLIEKSDGLFIRPGASRISLTKHYFSGPEFARHLRTKAVLQNFSLAGSASDFIDQIASESSLKKAPYTVRLNDGTEKELKDWLRETLKLKPPEKKEE